MNGTPTWKSLATGDLTTVGVKRDGSLWVWGWNRKGGDGTASNFSMHIERGEPPVALTPTRVGDGQDWASVASAGQSLLALKTDGTLWGWPREDRRDADDESDDTNRTVVAVPPSPAFPIPRRVGPDADWSQIATAPWHSFALKSDGSLWGWGDNRDGVLGIDARGDHAAPVRIGKDRWRSVIASHFRTAGIRQDGTLWAWGWRLWGRKEADSASPALTQVGTDGGWTAASISDSHVLALRSDGSLWGFGESRDGQLGPGAPPRDTGTAAVRVGKDNDWLATAAGYGFSLAIKQDGSLWAWGANARGQLGDGTIADRSSPVRVGKDAMWRSVYAKDDHVVAEQADGSTWTWGNDSRGQLGDGRLLVQLAPVQVQPGRQWRFAAGEEAFTIAMREDGTLWTWGGGVAETHPGPRVEWTALAQYRGLAAIGIQKDGSLWQLLWPEGKLEKIEEDSFKKSGPAPHWVRLSATDHGVVVQDANNRLSILYRVTVNNDREIWQTRPIGGATGWGTAFAEVEPGTVLAQKPDGTLWLIHDDWKDAPAVQVDKKVNWEALAVGEFELLALAKNGQLWRYEGESKQRVGASIAWKTVSVSKSYSLAVARDGTLWSWGEGRAGELGTVYAGEQRSPVRVGKDANWETVFAADDHSLALRTDGSLWAWGNNLHGQLGAGPPLYRTTPGRLEIP